MLCRTRIFEGCRLPQELQNATVFLGFRSCGRSHKRLSRKRLPPIFAIWIAHCHIVRVARVKGAASFDMLKALRKPAAISQRFRRVLNEQQKGFYPH
jgi:hypothetical protein